MKKASGKRKNKPSIFTYHDYRSFLMDMMEYQSKHYEKLNLSLLAKKSGVAISLLSMILNNKRNMTGTVLEKILPFFKLNKNEKSFLKSLVQLADADTQPEREQAYQKLLKFSEYKERSKEHIKAHSYLKSWLNVTIREMAGLPDFQLDPEWIKGRLKTKAQKSEIKDSIQFLIKEGFITIDEKGQVKNGESFLDCDGGVYRLGLSQLHTQFLNLAIESIYETSRDYRNIRSITFPIYREHFSQIKAIMDKAYHEIEALIGDVNLNETDMVYHVSLYSFPLTDLKKGEE